MDSVSRVSFSTESSAMWDSMTAAACAGPAALHAGLVSNDR
jgi:hypothetical protein